MSPLTRNDPPVVKALQRDLRALGYLRAGIDGVFGQGTAAALRACRYDLLHNDGASRGGDGRAPVAVLSYNRGRVHDTAGDALDPPLADCIAEMAADPAFPKLPSSADPAADNRRANEAIAAMRSALAPRPFVQAIAQQESDGRHFAVPHGADEDSFVVVGTDHARGAPPEQITSRGYGIGQYTLFHHPPTADEVRRYILDPVGSAGNAFRELREKFDGFVASSADRNAERPRQSALRLCKYAATDARYMADCVACARAVRTVDIAPGTRLFPGAAESYQTDAVYPAAVYRGVPDRAEFGCDWPYAVRRYNGDGLDSYHYQTIILKKLLAMTA
jgi:hypothetical protein